MNVSARNVKLSLLRRAREIISDRDRWTQQYLRTEKDGKERFCVLGAIEKAAYDLGLAEPPDRPFDGAGSLGYQLGDDLSLETYAAERYECAAWSVNDSLGYETTLEMLDGYIGEVEAGRLREPLTEEMEA